MLAAMWRILVHGGATDSCPDFDRQNEIKSALSQVIAHSAKLLSGGAHAKDVVVEAVRALEDCSLFNAGKGSALTKDGRCEVNVNGSSLALSINAVAMIARGWCC